MRAPSVIVDAVAEFRVLRAGPSSVGDGGSDAPFEARLPPVAPAFVVRLCGPAAESAAEALWRRAEEGRPREAWAGAAPGSARWVADLLRAQGLPTRLWPEATCTETRSDLPGMWEFTVRAPCGTRAGVDGVRFRVGPTPRRAVRNLLRRSGWLFLVLRAGDRTVGVLAVRPMAEAGGPRLSERWHGGWERLGAWCIRALEAGGADASPAAEAGVGRRWASAVYGDGREAAACAPVGRTPVRTSSTRVEVTVESLGEAFADADAVLAALADPARRDLAPVLYVTFGGPDADGLAAALWDGHRAPDEDGRRAPEPWMHHFAATRGLEVRVAEGAVLRLRHRHGSWTETWLTALGTAASTAGAGHGCGPDAMIGWRLDSATAVRVEAALGRSGWVFVVLRTAGGSRGVLGVRHAEVLRGPAVAAERGG